MDFRPFHFQIASLGRMNAGLQPVKIGVASRLYRQDQKFRRLVGVQLAQTDFERRQLVERSFNHQHRLIGRFDLVMPAVDGMDCGQQGCAGGQPHTRGGAAGRLRNPAARNPFHLPLA